MRERGGPNCVPCLGNRPAELFDNPQAFDLTSFDGFDLVVSEWIVVGRVDHHGFFGKPGDQRRNVGNAVRGRENGFSHDRPP